MCVYVCLCAIRCSHRIPLCPPLRVGTRERCEATGKFLVAHMHVLCRVSHSTEETQDRKSKRKQRASASNVQRADLSQRVSIARTVSRTRTAPSQLGSAQQSRQLRFIATHKQNPTYVSQNCFVVSPSCQLAIIFIHISFILFTVASSMKLVAQQRLPQLTEAWFLLTPLTKSAQVLLYVYTIFVCVNMAISFVHLDEFLRLRLFWAFYATGIFDSK